MRAKADTLITLEREGEFTVRWLHSHNKQCGNVGTQILRYHVWITGYYTELGPDGWLLDNNDIPYYFEQKYKHVADFQSCEKITHNACRDFAAVVRGHGSKPLHIKVAVSGIPGSWITCEWNA